MVFFSKNISFFALRIEKKRDKVTIRVPSHVEPQEACGCIVDMLICLPTLWAAFHDGRLFALLELCNGYM